MADHKISIRVPDELIAKIDQLGASRGYQRSQTIRFILQRAVETPALEAAIGEEIAAFQAMLQEKMQRIRRRVREILVEELLGGSSDAGVAVEPPTRALPAPGADVVEGEVLEGLSGRGRRSRKRTRG